MADLSIARGEELVVTGVATRSGGAIDITLAGSRIWFTAKKRVSDADAAAAIKKDAATAPAAALWGGVVRSAGGVYAVTVLDTDTTPFTVTELLNWSIWLEEVDGTRTRLDHGTLKVQMA